MENLDTTKQSETCSKKGAESVEIIAIKKPESFIGLLRGHTRLVASGTAIISVTLLRGFETSFLGSIASLPAFQLAFGILDGKGHRIIPSMWLGLWSASGSIGSLIGSLAGGWSQDAIGRRRTLALAGILQAASVTISYLADQASTIDGRGAVYFVGKTVQGIAVGALMCTAQAYISEVLPPTIRPSILSLIAPFNTLGQILGLLVIKSQVHNHQPVAYRLPIACQWIFSMIPLLVVLIFPESPVWLMRKGSWTQAQKACQRLAGTQNADSTYVRLSAEVMREKEDTDTRKISYMELFQRRSDLRRTGIVTFASIIPTLFGLGLLSHFAYFAEILGMSASQATTFFLIGSIIGLVISFFASYVLARVSRRPLLVISMVVMAVFWASIGIVAFFPSAVAPWYTAIAMTLILCFASIGAWPVSYAVSGETSTLRLRGKAAGVAWFTHSLIDGTFAVVLPYIYNSDAGDLGGKIGLVYFAVTGLGALGSWALVPEMKDRTPVELDEMFEANVPTRKFREYTAIRGGASVCREQSSD